MCEPQMRKVLISFNQTDAKRFILALTIGTICHMIIDVYKFYISFSGETSEGV